VLEILDVKGTSVPAGAIVEGLARVAWPGRLDRRTFADGREMLLDAAHNPDAAAALARYLAADAIGPRPIVFAAMRDKDAAGILRHLAPAASTFVITRASQARSADPDTLARLARAVAPDTAVLVEADVDKALAAAWGLSPHIVVTGSIFLLGDVISRAERS
jgi:dihydrofolate synthase/folylpolyglutamate synthase